MLSYVAVWVASLVLYNMVKIAILIPGIVQFLLMAALSFGIVFVATILPIYRIAMKKPIDAINNK